MNSKLVMLAIAAVLVVANCTAAHSDLARLCDGSLASISSLSQAKAILDENNSHEESNCAQYKNSLAKLEPIIVSIESGDFCKLNLVEQIESYHAEFVKTKSFLIPDKLRDFFVALSFDVSSKCKKYAANLLATDSNIRVTKEELEELNSVESKSPTELKDVLLVDDIKQMAGKYFDRFKVIVSTEAGEKFRTLMLVCENKFKPFYSQLLLPSIKLAKLGYNRKVQEEEEQILSSWFGAIRVCESMAAAEIFEDKANIVGDKKALTFVSPDKATALRNSQGSLSEDVRKAAQPIEYSPPKSSIEAVGEVSSVSANELEQLAAAKKVKPFDTRKLIKKALKSKLKSALSSGKLRFKSLTSINCSKTCKTEVEDVTVNALNDLDNLSLQRVKRDLHDKIEVALEILFCVALVLCALLVGIMFGIGWTMQKLAQWEYDRQYAKLAAS